MGAAGCKGFVEVSAESKFHRWKDVATCLRQRVAAERTRRHEDALLDEGQCASLSVLAERLEAGKRAFLLADEVGMGKTRIAAALIDAVKRCGGRAAVVIPGGLGAQWRDELRRFAPDDQMLLPLRSYESFVRGFSEEGDEDGVNEGGQRRREEKLRDRKAQRELPTGAWADEKILMISHAFARMSFPLAKDSRNSWRRELMPAMQALVNGRKRNMAAAFRGERRATHRAAAAAFATTKMASIEVKAPPSWHSLEPAEYRAHVLPVIGRALGRFDLVVIDEAHKARGADSSLSRILGPVLWQSEDAFRLGMTATPVELNAGQWIDVFTRLFRDSQEQSIVQWADLEAKIKTYEAVVKRLLPEVDSLASDADTEDSFAVEPLTEDLVTEFERAAGAFQESLAPYVIRRDKRSDPLLAEFKETHGDYRDVQMVKVSPAQMEQEWLRVFCAAEAISLLPQTDPNSKRQRLMLEKGHGVDTLVSREKAPASSMVLDFWSKNLQLSEKMSAYNHPAILAAVETIKKATDEGRKVLVFGTLKAPLRALVQLLNARALLQDLGKGRRWPMSKVPAEMEAAVKAVLSAGNLPADLPTTLIGLNGLLSGHYEDERTARENSLRTLRSRISEKATGGNDIASLVLKVWSDDKAGRENEESLIGNLLQTLDERAAIDRNDTQRQRSSDWDVDRFLGAVETLLQEIVTAASDDFDEKEQDISSANIADRTTLFRDYLTDYSGRVSRFARLLDGDTKPQTRNLLQRAFNRAGAWPIVLVAQSQVGREGLNLHEQCRTVVLLHAEWNPGVVEQQIGRVDRKNSRFLKDYLTWDGKAPVPKIEIHCIQLEGGYDSHHWSVLTRRWASLRAQLHGDVVSPQDRKAAESDVGLKALVKRLDDAAPNFHPKPCEKPMP